MDHGSGRQCTQATTLLTTVLLVRLPSEPISSLKYKPLVINIVQSFIRIGTHQLKIVVEQISQDSRVTPKACVPSPFPCLPVLFVS
jgi:hypothetical protein